MKALCLLLFLCLPAVCPAQKDTLPAPREYRFIIQDAPAQHFTMRQVNESYLSGYRLLARVLDQELDNQRISNLIQLSLIALFLQPLTHEEGHRAILTALNIGSVSQPYFNRYGAAYLKGVTDATLRGLRDSDLPNYIRLHTAGLESDYMLTRRMEATGSFGLDDFSHYRWEYLTRKLGILQYYVLGLFGFEVGITEEEDELLRDVMGYDTYGAARHLFRPDMEFYRYTRHDELTPAEALFIRRAGFRSLLNLLNPLMIGQAGFSLGESTRVNLGMGYTMAPFGDFIDENIWIKHNKLNISFYARQFQNRSHWFHGFGLGLTDYPLNRHLLVSLTGHYWNQPVGLDFNTAESFRGGAIDLDVRYFFHLPGDSGLRALSIDLGIIGKTRGFLPEELNLNRHVGIRLGTTVRW
ncbi:MAG: hypothetical protein R6V75_06240 [Bacteroidales bacterium]